jgi:fused signal recognition particle receptor
MFEKLRSAFSDAAKSLGEKELNEKDIESILFELEISLLESDVAGEVIDEIKSDLKEKLIGSKVNKHEVEKFVKDSLISSISALFDTVEKVDLIEKINEKKKQGQPFLVLFVGINGTGKTTSLAKIAHLLQQAKFSVVIAAADTFRAGAIEQLREHTNRLNLKLVAQNYNSDPAAVARDAVLYAKSHKTDCVLIDTAGRMQTSENLMQQIAKITKVVNPDMKIFVGDSLAGNDTVNQAREFFKHVQFDASILTKSDADAKGGAALSIVKVTSTPIIYLGVGQEYPDLKPFNKDTFLKDVFGSLDNVDIKESPEPEPQLESPEPEPQLESPEPEPQLESPEPDVVEKSTTESSDDPFEGISDDDIATYSDLYDIPPPENDDDAIKSGNKIRKWIKDGRLEPGESKTDEKITDGVHKQDKEEEPKKKRGQFGFLRK